MEERLIRDILTIKEKSIRNLLNWTESPIERIFLLEFIKVIEDSVSNPNYGGIHPSIRIDGYTFLPQIVEHDQVISFTGHYCGIEIKYTDFAQRLDPISSNLFYRDGKPTKRRVQKIKVSQEASLVYQTLSVFPQYRVKIGDKSYRLDFAFILTESDNEISTNVKHVGIECDGYKYHSSPEQFSKDRSRNRALNGEDWTIIQYSGAEIYSGKVNFKEEFAKLFSILGFGEHGLRGEYSGYRLNLNNISNDLPF